MENFLSVIGFYFTLIGFICGLFFTRLDSWYGNVREFWSSIALIKKEPNKIDALKQARIKQKGLRESSPKGSFVSVGFFTVALTAMSFWVPMNSSELNWFIFLKLPLVVTVLLYWIGGIILLTKGMGYLSEANKEIEDVLSPKPG